jgi:hypothetical protein
MALDTTIPSKEDLHQKFIDTAQSIAPELTDDSEGSIFDTVAGVTALAVSELMNKSVEHFSKTFFETAHGSEITGGADDLQTLAVDHFGDKFARPQATKSTGVVAFSRPTAAFGNVTIPVGTIVKTLPNANGESQRFETTAAVLLTGTTINASVRAIEAGTAGNVNPSTVQIIESTLLDSTITVNNVAAFAGGAPAENDADYLVTIKDLIETLRGATKAAIEAQAKTVAGVVTATAIEEMTPVIEYDIANDQIMPGALFFRIPFPTLYIADANGTASPTLIDDVKTAIKEVRALGVGIQVLGATQFLLSWIANMTLNPFGANFAELSVDPTKIEDSMREYLAKLPIGTGFDRNLARSHILSIWGAAGTNDLTDFQTSTPSGNITATAVTKIIPNNVEIA